MDIFFSVYIDIIVCINYSQPYHYYINYIPGTGYHNRISHLPGKEHHKYGEIKKKQREDRYEEREENQNVFVKAYNLLFILLGTNGNCKNSCFI